MIHQMGLYEEYFKLIKAGQKKVEVRLNDSKRRKIKIGDIIEFAKLPEQKETLKVRVRDLKKYETFVEMYETIPLECFGGESQTVQEMIDGTYEIYTPTQEKEWGTLAITIQLLA